MVPHEAALTATVGAFTGMSLGIVLAAARVRALAGAYVIKLSVPFAPLAAYLAIVAVGGVLAGMLPGRRAARMDVLDAIATQ